MTANTLPQPLKLLAPTRDISARMPPSPWLSARMTNRQYFIEIVMIRVQTINERTPSALSTYGQKCLPACRFNHGLQRCTSGLVPRSPYTMLHPTPSAPPGAVVAEVPMWWP